MVWLVAILAQSGDLSFEFLERNRHIIYPALGILVVVLLGAAVFAAWKTPELAGAEKARVKGEIIRAMRQNIGWITAAELAEILELETHTVAKLLSELKEDDVVVSAMIENLVHYRLRSV